ncbi:F-box domain-containing protein [Heracleum sosnowskyi]|uniref:F-box domain-containing protein n=1 Tax=Heracleum sosnowskyi TaxID=360622 RepID=A0AAD8HQN1_9APIA|nr:F-box domain-containing protein [Heracleum sosnowskyi]
MSLENEIQISVGDCVKKQVMIVNNSLVSDDCPRLSVRPGSNTYTGFINNIWPSTISRKPNTPPILIDNQISTTSSSNSSRNSKKVRKKIASDHQLSSFNLRHWKENKSPQRLWFSGFFQAQLRMMKTKRNKGKLSSNISVDNQFSHKISRTSTSSPQLKKMTSNCPQLGRMLTSVPNQINTSSPQLKKMTRTAVPNQINTSCPILNKNKGGMTLLDSYSPILKKHRKMLDGRRIHDLPMELVAKILKRLPVKYILRCRCVKKSWHSLIQSPMFITLHLNYQKKNIITTTTNRHYKYLFFQNQFAIKLTIRFDDVNCQEYCKIEFPPSLPKYAWFAVSYGLVCVSSTLRIDSDYNRNIYLWNPLIQKYKTLPDSPLPSKQDWEEWEALAFGFVPEVNDYVVVHIIKPCLHPNSHSLIIGVYSLNTNSWKKLRRDKVFISRLFSNDDDVVFINGAAYWVGVNLDKHKILMCFDTKTDILSEISLPDWVPPKLMPVIYPFGQSIAYFVWEHRVNHFDMWVLKDDLINGFVWEKKMCISTGEDVREEVLGVRNNGEPILAKFNNLITYNLDSHEADDFVDSWDRWTPESPYQEGFAPRYVISPFVESLVLFDIDCNC